ncbi:helix-turn-helix transcriptional regulator [Methylocaldum sp.]|uniref:helix-turn-helix transcriptional regulator n=1 Tax=Methylocaldum sp. TaxID=1969727 RepID=UPI002D6A877D|nr:helix-turn-helix transcriptional regulator [Methylocaldum sp.]HYE34791.1 helix-turn-helix transcriptional regulator [Methylocaldum sp.]
MADSAMPCSLEDFSAVVEVIYDCVIQPERWREAVRMICALCESPYGSVAVFDLETCDNIRLYDHGYSPDYWFEYQRYANEHPILPAVRLMPEGDVTTIALGCGDEEFFGSRVYREFLQPRGQCDFLGLLALRTGSRIGYLHACRNVDQPRFGDDQVRIFKLLSKHVCRAMKISDLFDLRIMQTDTLEQTLDGLAAGVFLCARDGRVVYMNSAARRQTQAGQALRIVSNRLSPIDPNASRQLASALANAVDDEVETLHGGHSIALPDRAGAGLVATVLPLNRGKRQSISKPFTGAAAIFVQDPAVLPLFPGEAFAKLYGLTGGELRVALAMAPGLQLEEIADMLGIGLQTVKTHLQHIFQKTNTSRQADLVALMSRVSGPIKAH